MYSLLWVSLYGKNAFLSYLLLSQFTKIKPWLAFKGCVLEIVFVIAYFLIFGLCRWERGVGSVRSVW